MKSIFRFWQYFLSTPKYVHLNAKRYFFCRGFKLKYMYMLYYSNTWISWRKQGFLNTCGDYEDVIHLMLSCGILTMLKKRQHTPVQHNVKHTLHDPVSNQFAAKRLLILITCSSVVTGLAHSKLIIWTDHMLTRRVMFRYRTIIVLLLENSTVFQNWGSAGSPQGMIIPVKPERQLPLDLACLLPSAPHNSWRALNKPTRFHVNVVNHWTTMTGHICNAGT